MNRAEAGRIGGLVTAGTRDASEMTSPARSAWMDSWEKKADPDLKLTPQERARRAKALRRAHMHRLAARSAESRRKRAGAGPG